MKYKSYDYMNCSIAKTLDVIGERWTLLILRDAFAGVHKFSKFQEQLGISRNILTARLNRLVDEGIFEKVSKVEGGHAEYHLTKKGYDLQPVLLSLAQWGEQYKPNPNGQRTYFIEHKTKQPIRRMEPTSQDGRPLKHDEVIAVAGPGLINNQH